METKQELSDGYRKYGNESLWNRLGISVAKLSPELFSTCARPIILHGTDRVRVDLFLCSIPLD